MTKRTIIILSTTIVLFIAAFFIAKSTCSDASCSAKQKANTSIEKDRCNKCGKASCYKKCSSNPKNSNLTEIAPSCNIEGMKDRETAEKWIRKNIWSKMTKINELPTGYEMVFEKPSDSFEKVLFDYLKKERACCPTFSYALVFEPNGTIKYQYFGSKEIKSELKEMFTELELL